MQNQALKGCDGNTARGNDASTVLLFYRRLINERHNSARVLF